MLGIKHGNKKQSKLDNLGLMRFIVNQKGIIRRFITVREVCYIFFSTNIKRATFYYHHQVHITYKAGVKCGTLEQRRRAKNLVYLNIRTTILKKIKKCVAVISMSKG